MSKPTRIVLMGQLIWITGIALCTILMPHYLFSSDEGGMSNYGTHTSTVVAFSVAFLGVGVSLLVAAQSLVRAIRAQRIAACLLTLLGTLIIIVTLTTYAYQDSPLLHLIHIASAEVLFIAELPAALWFWSQQKNTHSNALFGIYLTGLVLAVATLLGAVHVLFVAQLLSEVSLGLLLASSLQTISQTKPAGPAYKLAPRTL